MSHHSQQFCGVDVSAARSGTELIHKLIFMYYTCLDVGSGVVPGRATQPRLGSYVQAPTHTAAENLKQGRIKFVHLQCITMHV